MKREQGFTVIEVAIAVLVLLVLAVFFVVQRNDLEEANRDQQRKTAINAMYYSLTEDFYARNNYYPRTISREQLPAMDPTLFTDPSGYTLDGDKCTYTGDDDQQKTDGKCEYHYSASSCDNEGHCQSFTLSADLETEASYRKSSSNSD